jgi:hypothetical protein
MYFIAEIMCCGSGMSMAHACICIGYQKMHGEAREWAGRACVSCIV